jgi:hypothetical protein
MTTVDCPICGGFISFESSPKLDQAVLCSSCETLLAVIAIRPIELDVAENIPVSQVDRRKNRRGNKVRKKRISDDELDEWDEDDYLTRPGRKRKGKNRGKPRGQTELDE